MGELSEFTTAFLPWAPLVVSLVAVWLGYTYQLYALDRETRKRAYVDAYDCLERMADLLADLEHVNKAQWYLTTKLDVSRPTSGATAQLLEDLEQKVGAGAVWAAMLLAVCSKLGAIPDWSVLGDQGSPGSAMKTRQLLSLFTSLVLREQEVQRDRFNYSIIAASTSSRYGILWLFILRLSRVQRKTQQVFRNIFGELETLVLGFGGDLSRPNPVDWGYVESMLDDARKQFARDIGTLGRGWDRAPFGRRRERVEWPEAVLLSARKRWEAARASGRVYSRSP